jgi:hypothetical protein
MAPGGEGSAHDPIEGMLDRLAVLVDGVVAQQIHRESGAMNE